MVIYRPHMGLLVDSMAKSIEFDGIEEMKKYIVTEDAKIWGKPAFDVEDIVIGDEVFADERIGWNDARNVCVKRYFDENYVENFGCPQCIGYCATDYTQKF